MPGKFTAAARRSPPVWGPKTSDGAWVAQQQRPRKHRARTQCGNGWIAQIRNPASGYVSLRGTIAGVVDQTVIRAYSVG
jgi:hypothetical protein